MKYKDAGVDIDAGNEIVRRIRSLARSTFTPGVLSDIGSFGGLFRLDRDRYQDPVLVSSADGVGTKLKVAFMTGRHDTVGADLVNHCVNDILVQGAEPLFFLDYLATGRLSPVVAEQVVAGVARACRENGCALIGGETAEMPGFYADGEYNIAGFIVGIVEKSKLIDGRSVVPGDVLIGLPSTGLHTNGYSLARRVFFEAAGWKVDTFVRELNAMVGDVLLAPHRSYLPLIKPFFDRQAWTVPPIFRVLQQRGDITDAEMFRTFNMGIGLVIVCASREADRIINTLSRAGEPNAIRIGFVVSGDRTVTYL
ncbi:MAG: phosphoribosylformylglycinamidine cyclo-ligase [Acidobacteria bacterium]|nr:MAG: phosphoribosylformylglycinamidine cyclo-ligase [Acidobacteriota bacterium]